MKNLYPPILGCLLGTAVGDAVGLRREGLSRRRATKMYGGPPLGPDFILGRGMCSDDTEHTLMVGRSLVISAGHTGDFQREMARQLKRWLLTGPAGIGIGTLKACVRLLIGMDASRSGVQSAGNGPAMRSALLGVCAENEEHLKQLVRASTRITHTDPRAEEGALLVARAAGLATRDPSVCPSDFLADAVSTIQGEELRQTLSQVVTALSRGVPTLQFAESQGWSGGVTGYVNQTVPAALYCWAHSPDDFRRCVENAVLLGGDTDSVAAITGAVCGANLGTNEVPKQWTDRLAEWPRTIRWMEQLARDLASMTQCRTAGQPPSMHWLATVPRNFVFGTLVMAMGFRRLLPPY